MTRKQKARAESVVARLQDGSTSSSGQRRYIKQKYGKLPEDVGDLVTGGI